ncbi:MAG: DUF58 domain-containing protein, partial [Psychroflexus sp.]
NDFVFKNNALKFKDLETGNSIKLFADAYQSAYQTYMQDYTTALKSVCLQYKISYVSADINSDFQKILESYFVENQILKS